MKLEVYKFQISTTISSQKGPSEGTEFEASRDNQKWRDWTRERPLGKLLEQNPFRPDSRPVTIYTELRRIQQKSLVILVFTPVPKLRKDKV